MAVSGDALVTLVLFTLVVSNVYHTVLAFTLSTQIASRLAVAESKVSQLWDEALAAKGRL